jgi:hypothetical protein
MFWHAQKYSGAPTRKTIFPTFFYNVVPSKSTATRKDDEEEALGQPKDGAWQNPTHSHLDPQDGTCDRPSTYLEAR